MTVEKIQIDTVKPYADQRYEWVEGMAHFAVDPEHPANQRIVDLALAPRGDDGLVRFEADLRLLRPIDGGSGNLLFEVPNRGMVAGFTFGMGGDALLLDRGWTIAWCGWQWDVIRGSGGLGLDAPYSDVAPGWMRMEWRADTPSADHSLSDSLPGLDFLRFADYPTVDVGDPDAMLTVRTSLDGEPITLARDTWRFTDDTHIELDGGFAAFHWYQLVYRTSRAPVAGCGLLAIRDIVSHLRGVGSRIEHAFAFGGSQSGRLLRQFLWDRLNVDEAGATVFDGVFCHIASGARGEFNHRYAQPSATAVIGFGNLPPFDNTGLLERQRTLGGVPKAMFTNSASEYWLRGEGALLHVDPNSGEDLPEDPDARTYLLAGADHLGAIPFKHALPVANPAHDLDVAPILRALLIVLQEWVRDGVEPPGSRVPRASDGTATNRVNVLARFAHTARPDPAILSRARRIDLGPDADRGIGRWPVRLGQPYVDLVSAVDDDGNEVAGIRLPAVTAPLATYTGWNPRRHIEGLPDVLYERIGSKAPFPPGRPLVTERYPTRHDYERAVRAAAEKLVAERFLLAGDINVAVEAAVTDYPDS
ncbi:MAG: hypothetical protein J2P17_07915 [Mycobacterium sp.]|nr:hypothetical protein [Mycobacterium sp.]